MTTWIDNNAAADQARRAAAECLRGGTGRVVPPIVAAAVEASIDSSKEAAMAGHAALRASQASRADDGDDDYHDLIADALFAYAALSGAKAAQRVAAVVRRAFDGKPPIDAAPHLRRANAAQRWGDAAEQGAANGAIERRAMATAFAMKNEDEE